MDNVKLIKIIILVLLVFLVIGFFGFYFFKNEPEPILSETTAAAVSLEGQKILSALNELEDIRISREVFDDSVFKDLIDFSLAVNEELKGRPNPFAPIRLEDRGASFSGERLPIE